MMHMSFWFGTDLNDFLFYGLNISSNWGLILLCGILILSVWLQQALRLALAYTKSSPQHVPCPDHTNLLNTPFRRTHRWREMLSEGCLYILEVVAAYLLMLVVMTYNAWLLIAVVFGYGFAYGTLGHKLAAMSHKPLLPCTHCLFASESKIARFSSSPSIAGSSTPVVSQVDLAPPLGTTSSETNIITASVHL